MRKMTIPLIALFLVIFLVTLFLFLTRSPGIPQPIAFNHHLHTEDNGIECLECHSFYMDHSASGLPGADVCRGCHEEAMTDSPEEKKLVELLGSENGPHFRKLFRLPEHVFYSHRRHVAIAELECERCHGDIAKTESPPSRPLVNVDMDSCMDCHDDLGVTNDCITCHM